MATAIVVVWSVGLLVALVKTVVLLKQVAIVLRTLRHIHELALDTRTASRRLVRHLESATRLDALPAAGARLRAAGAAAATVCDALAGRLEAMTLPRGAR